MPAMKFERTRTRTEDGRVLMTRTEQSRIGNSGCTAGWTNKSSASSYAGSFLTRTVEDNVTPGYWKRKKAGLQLPVLDFQITTVEDHYGIGVFTHNGTQVDGYKCLISRYVGQTGGDICIPFLPPVPAVGALSSALTYTANAAAAQAAAATYDIATDVAESRSTLASLMSLVKAFMTGLEGAVVKIIESARRKGVRRSAVSALEELQNTWMLARYGLRPIVYSIQDLIDAVSRRAKKRDDGRRSQTFNKSEAYDVVTPGTLAQPDQVWHKEVQLEMKVRGFAWADFSSEKARFGANAFVTAWELTRLSFVLDWFVNVGDWIMANTTISASIWGVGNSIKTVTRQTVLYSQTYPGRVVGNVRHTGGGTVGMERVTTTYTRFASEVKLPAFYPRLDTWKKIDIAILIAQRLKAIKRLRRFLDELDFSGKYETV